MNWGQILIALFILVFISGPVSAQKDSCGDIITMKNGSTVKAKILELTEDEVVYKRCANITGPEIRISRQYLYSIKILNDTLILLYNEKPKSKKPAKIEEPLDEKLYKSHRNVVFLNIGVICYNINIERTLFFLDHTRINLRVGYGKWGSWSGGGNDFILNWNYLVGRKRSHFEMGVGGKFKIDDDTGGKWHKDLNNIWNTYFIPVVNAGYRFEPLKEGFVFRVGVGSESGIYLSVGLKL